MAGAALDTLAIRARLGTKPAELRAYAASLVPVICRDRALSVERGLRSLLEEHDYRIDEIDGQVPAALRGTLFRNGMGRNELGGQWFAHWFDGDGMIQAIRFDAQGIHYRNRYVATENYRDELRAGHIVYRGFGKMRPGGVLANAFREPANVSNTSVMMNDGRLFSLWEGGPPYELDPATLETRGVADFGGTLKAFSAHPRLDPDSGELFNFGIDYGRRTTLTPYRLQRGALTRLAPVTLPYPLMNHDFVLTEHYLVFCLGPILVHSLKFLLGFSSFDGALHWEGGKPTLILLVPRNGGAPRFIETEPFFQFHFANGYEQDGAIVLDVARYPDSTWPVIGRALRDYWKSDWPAQGMATFTRLRIDLGPSGSRAAVDSRPYAAGSAVRVPAGRHLHRTAKRLRYAYIACTPADRAVGRAATRRATMSNARRRGGPRRLRGRTAMSMRAIVRADRRRRGTMAWLIIFDAGANEAHCRLDGDHRRGPCSRRLAPSIPYTVTAARLAKRSR